VIVKGNLLEVAARASIVGDVVVKSRAAGDLVGVTDRAS
jgi:hypothetical protein